MNDRPRLMGVSDVSTGYGSPQIPLFMHSLQVHYAGAATLLVEPNQPERPPRGERFPDLGVRRLPTLTHPHSSAGRIEYVGRAAEAVDDYRPDVLVVFCSYSLPVLFRLRRRPPFVIYYRTEFSPAYGALDIEMNGHIGSLVDLVIDPEENRAAREIEVCGYTGVPGVVMYNCCNDTRRRPPIPPRRRNGRLIYQGTIDGKRTFAGYYLDPRLSDQPIDLFGWVTGPDRGQLETALRDLIGSVRYFGVKDYRVLARLRRKYAYGLVSWNPLDDQHRYSCPNKFFELIADGVPPVTAPHPQPRKLVERYRCGLLMRDWSFEGFHEAVLEASRVYGTADYEDLVRNCRRAVQEELNWQTQFARVVPWLPV